MYFLAIVFPPLGCLAAGRIGSAFMAFLLCLTCVCYPLAAIYACSVVTDSLNEQRHEELLSQTHGLASGIGSRARDDDDDRPRRRRR